MRSVINTHTHTHSRRQSDTRNILQVMDMFPALIVGIISWVYAYINTCENVYITYMHFLYIKYTSI